jgi:hypothetical protein
MGKENVVSRNPDIRQKPLPTIVVFTIFCNILFACWILWLLYYVYLEGSYPLSERGYAYWKAVPALWLVAPLDLISIILLFRRHPHGKTKALGYILLIPLILVLLWLGSLVFAVITMKG